MGIFSFFTGSKIKSVSTTELDELIGKVNIIDVREPFEYKQRAIKAAKNIPLSKAISGEGLDKNKTYYIICQSGMRSMKASKALDKLGFNVINVSGGMGSYRGKKLK